MVTPKCSAHCSALFSFWLVTESGGGEMSHEYKGVGKVLHELLLGKFLIGAEILFRFDNSFFFFSCESCCNSNALLCVVVVPSERWRPLQRDIYMGRSRHVSGFSASLLLHKWEWLCGAVQLGEWSMTIATQQAPRVKYIHSFGRKSDRNLALWPFFFCQAELMWSQMQQWCLFFQCV